ncbi:putative Zn-dependent protease [Leptolyngbyaceae cyanobacterium JSC-12]|nr:putative Zn-dependent protease [Leptolyngbyaceae cyanobacterium JSC-12]
MKQIKRHWRFSQERSLLIAAIAFCITLIIPFINPLLTFARPASPPSTSSLENLLAKLPPPRPHPLPRQLSQWLDPNQSGDYFEQVRPAIVGALIWSTFPITVYVQPPTEVDNANSFTARRAQTWVVAVEKAIQEWNAYLPLKQVTQENADIIILRSTPPIRLSDRAQDAVNTAKTATSEKPPPLPILRARSAETRFELYAKKPIPNAQPQLAHRMTIYIRPDQAIEYLQAAARHELGHALGIWGHSPQPTDALYASQVRNPAKISARDLNTLKRVYEQPTRLGWEMPS